MDDVKLLCVKFIDVTMQSPFASLLVRSLEDPSVGLGMGVDYYLTLTAFLVE